MGNMQNIIMQFLINQRAVRRKKSKLILLLILLHIININ